ncbi:hypothetical protein V6183_16885, partial [Enterobacter hormaechei]|uniref:hypothetical protein n=2 Tax=Enterobacter hormaechei TaxID=158836 RepID=UPI001BD1E900
DKPHQSLPSLIQKAKYTAALSWRHDPKLSSGFIFCALIIKPDYIFLFFYCSARSLAAHKLGVSAALTVNHTQEVLPLLHISFTSSQHLPFHTFTRHASFISATVFVCRLTYFVIKVLFRT